MARYTDDNIPALSESIPENVVSSLESCHGSLFESFSNNKMKENPEKYHLLMNVNTPATIKIGEHAITNSYCEKLLGVKADSQLNFSIIFKRFLKKLVKRYMFWLELCLTCVFEKDSY